MSAYRLYVFDPECQKIFDEAWAGDPYYLPAESAFPTSIQTFCLCASSNKAPVVSFSVFPYIKKKRWGAERVLRITRLLGPPVLKCDDEVFKALLREIMTIGKNAGVTSIEVDLYTRVSSRIFFPSTDCAVNTYNNTYWAEILEDAGFLKERETVTFEMDLNGYEADRAGEISFVKSVENDGKANPYYELWNQAGLCPYLLVRSKLWYPNAFGWPRVWYSDLIHLINRDDYIIYAARNSELVGFAHWWPNIYPMLRKKGRKAICLPENMVDDVLRDIDEAKIFKLVVHDKRAKAVNVNSIEKALINESLRVMKQRFGIKRCQLANISPAKHDLITYIAQIGGRKVHENCVLRSSIR